MKDMTVKYVQCMCGVTYGRGSGNGGIEGEGIWLMNLIYIYEIEQ
jgi:hypothetical protein